MHLAAYLKTGPTASYASAWRHPSAPLHDIWDAERYEHLLGATLNYQFTQKIFGTASSTFADNDSTQDLASFQSFSLSLGVTVQF